MLGGTRGPAAPPAGSEVSHTPYQPLAGTTLNSGPSFGAEKPRRAYHCCFNTQGRAFNFVVGVVICFSAVLLWLEADLGYLGVASGPDSTPHSLSADLRSIGLGSQERQALRDELDQGLQADASLKKEASSFLKEKLGKDRAPDLRAGASPREAYTVCEYFVVLFFILEMMIRFCDQCGAYCSDPWFGLDLLVVLQGVLDLTLPFAASTYASLLASGLWGQVGETLSLAWIMSLCRLMRVLRVLRLMRLSPRLRFLARDFARATNAAMWVGLSIFVTNFVCAIFISSLIGQRAYQWGDKADRIDDWFGSVGKSMHTLFAVMTLSGWTEIAEVLGELIPPVAVTVFFAAYLGACFFASLSLVTGLIGDAFVKSQLDSKERKQQHLEEQRQSLSAALEDLLARDAQEGSLLNREGFGAVLRGNPVIFDRLRGLGIRTDGEELDGLFEQLLAESGRQPDGLVRIDVLAEAMVSLRSPARASQLLEAKMLVRSLRREADAARRQAADLAAERHREMMAVMKFEQQRSTNELREQVVNLQTTLSQVQDSLGGVSSRLGGLAVVKQQLDLQDQRAQQEKAERHGAFVAMNEKLDTMSGRVASELLQLSGRVAQLEAKVDSAVSDMAEVSTRLGGASTLGREDTLETNVTDLTAPTMCSGRGSVSMWHEDVGGSRDDGTEAAAADEAGTAAPAEVPSPNEEDAGKAEAASEASRQAGAAEVPSQADNEAEPDAGV